MFIPGAIWLLSVFSSLTPKSKFSYSSLNWFDYFVFSITFVFLLHILPVGEIMLYDLGLSLFGIFRIPCFPVSDTNSIMLFKRVEWFRMLWLYICLLWFLLTFNCCLTSSGCCVLGFNNLLFIGNNVLVLLPNNLSAGEPTPSLHGVFRKFNNAR